MKINLDECEDYTGVAIEPVIIGSANLGTTLSVTELDGIKIGDRLKYPNDYVIYTVRAFFTHTNTKNGYSQTAVLVSYNGDQKLTYDYMNDIHERCTIENQSS